MSAKLSQDVIYVDQQGKQHVLPKGTEGIITKCSCFASPFDDHFYPTRGAVDVLMVGITREAVEGIITNGEC